MLAIVNPPHNQWPQSQPNIAVLDPRAIQTNDHYAARGSTLPPVSQMNFSSQVSASGQGWKSGSQLQPVAGGTTPLHNVLAHPQVTRNLNRTDWSQFPVATETLSSFNDNPGGRQCKIPGCRQPPSFDNHIQEHLDYCGTHVYDAISQGFAALCKRCRRLPARYGARYCSQYCSRADAGVQSVVRQQSTELLPPPTTLCEECRSLPVIPGQRFCSNQCAENNSRRNMNTVPAGFTATCQECRRPMDNTNRRFCSLECENASRGFTAACQECRRPMNTNQRFCSLECENASRAHPSRR
ncbi:hypothetical protein BJV74DRAFT_401586 [Russula compacta]|nr:hypothetical protein BJV74DRAFT_401586 [Russula compacta]